MAKHRIEYYDIKEMYTLAYYVNANTYIEAIAIFRESFSTERYTITEVAKVYDRDWSNF